MTFKEYQLLAARTIRKDLDNAQMEKHAMYGMVSELGELFGIYQKIYQGHFPEEEHMKKELGDLWWFIAEYCTANGWDMDEIPRMNIDKLLKRYPDKEGFKVERSLHRKDGDI